MCSGVGCQGHQIFFTSRLDLLKRLMFQGAGHQNHDMTMFSLLRNTKDGKLNIKLEASSYKQS